jgi:predicted CXXCH cytochrome family protein
MKPNITSKWMLALLLLFAARAGVAGTLSGSAHDLQAQGYTGGKVCVACHTPHNANATQTALWNHTLATTSYTLYTSATMKATAGQPGGSSKLCLSCHDGTVAIDSFGGAVAPTGVLISSANNLGANALNDDHPIGFAYSASLPNPTLFPTSKTVTIGTGGTTKTDTIANLLLYAGNMECSSCHDVHNTFTVGSTGMVKMATATSAICFACHNK